MERLPIHQKANPVAVMEIYPRYGSSFRFDSSDVSIIQMSVSKGVEGAGRWSAVVAPDQLGKSDRTLSELIPPFSLVVIYMERGDQKEIVMVGLVDETAEEQVWDTERNARRSIRLTGYDFGFVLERYAYFTLSFMGPISSIYLGQGLKDSSGFQLESTTGGMKTAATPWYQALFFWDSVLTKYLANTKFSYKNGKTLDFNDVLNTRIAPWPTPTDILIPTIMQWLVSAGSWREKLESVLPPPLYETYVMTIPERYASNTTASDNKFWVGGQGEMPYSYPDGIPVPNNKSSYVFELNGRRARVSYIARPSPIAKLMADKKGKFYYDDTAWESLPHYSIGEQSFLHSAVSFSVQGMHNIFMVLPNTLTKSIMKSEGISSTSFAMVLKTAAINFRSLAEFGPVIKVFPTDWFTESKEGPANIPSPPTSFKAITSNFGDYLLDRKEEIQIENKPLKGLPSEGVPTLVSEPVPSLDLTGDESTSKYEVQGIYHSILAFLGSYYGPYPWMLSGSVTIPLSPSIIAGSRFTYAPFKNGESWTFYVSEVSHNYRFGELSTTTLGLQRGLPDGTPPHSLGYSSPGFMVNLLYGRLVRRDGNYVADTLTNAPGLTSIKGVNDEDLKKYLPFIYPQGN